MVGNQSESGVIKSMAPNQRLRPACSNRCAEACEPRFHLRGSERRAREESAAPLYAMPLLDEAVG